jgi:phosphonate transport system permease protein
MKPLREAALAEAQALRRRRPKALQAPIRGRMLAGVVLLAALAPAVYGLWRLDFSFARFGSGLAQLAQIVAQMFPPSPGAHLWLYLHSLAETLAIALLGTLTAAILAFPVGFLAAQNVVPNVFAHFAVRRVLDIVRGVDVLIWALVFINVVGLGPFAGILAIAASDFGTFGKLFSEAIETSDRKQVEGVVASGGTRLHVVRFGLIPQSFPVIASQALYYFESNTRSATIIGIVGAGGIGLHLSEQIRVLEWGKVSFLVLMILATVAAIDWLSSRLRFAIIGQSAVVIG